MFESCGEIWFSGFVVSALGTDVVLALGVLDIQYM